VHGLKLTAKGYAYLRSNPRLINPVNWTKLAATGAIVAAIASVVALFVACNAIL